MSYREENGQVILTMDHLDWELLLMALGRALSTMRERDERSAFLSLVNRLNQGNPNYRPYQAGEKQS
jgi:hypothetical protein